MGFKGRLNLVIGKCPGRAKALIHGPKLIREHFTQVLPEYRLLAIEYIGTTFRTVDVLQIVGEHK